MATLSYSLSVNASHVHMYKCLQLIKQHVQKLATAASPSSFQMLQPKTAQIEVSNTDLLERLATPSPMLHKINALKFPVVTL